MDFIIFYMFLSLFKTVVSLNRLIIDKNSLIPRYRILETISC